MKKILFSIVFVFVCWGIEAQFILTPSGLKVKGDLEKGYVVYEYMGVDQSALYKKALLFIQKNFRSPKDVLNEIPYKSITIHGIQPNVIGVPYANKLDRRVMGNYSALYDIEYTITFRFKDEKMRVDIPSFDCYRIMKGGQVAKLSVLGSKPFLSDGHYIYSKKDGKLKQPEVKEQIEMFFNNFISDLKDSIMIDDDGGW